MAGKDPYAFQRVWTKIPTYVLDEPWFRKLTLAQRGVFVSMLMYSLKSSQIVGSFLDRQGEPLTDDDIGYGINARDADEVREVKAALQAFREATPAIVRWTRADGYAFLRFDQFLNEVNIIAKHKADAQRAAKSRAKKKSERGGREPSDNVVDLQRVRDEG